MFADGVAYMYVHVHVTNACHVPSGDGMREWAREDGSIDYDLLVTGS
jgi:hypothetical protein